MSGPARAHAANEPASPVSGSADTHASSEGPEIVARTGLPDGDSWAAAGIALDATPDTIALSDSILDAHGALVDVEIRFVNAVGRRRWFDGRSLDAIRGTRFVRDWPDIAALVFDIYADVVRTGEPHRSTREFATPAGPRLIDISVNAFPGGIVHIGRDVTDERRAMAAVREGDERLRRTIEGMNAILGYQDHKGAPVINSPQTHHILGYAPEDLRTHAAWAALVHPDDLPACREAWSARVGAWELTYRMRRADGTWIWVLDRGRSLPDGEPGILTLGVVVDVTAQRAAEDALRASEESLRRVIDGVDAIISVQDRSGGPAVLSHQVVGILGYRPDELAAYDDWKAIVHPDDLPRCLAAWHAPEDAWDIEYRARRSDGSWVWLADRGRRLDQGDGLGVGVFAVITDISEHKRAEEALRIAAERMHRFFDANIFGIVISEFGGRVLDANDYWIALAGRTRAEVHHGEVDWRRMTTPESLARDDRAITEIRDRGTSAPFEKEYTRPDGTRVPVLVVQSRMPGEGEQMASFVLDMTDLHDATANLARLAGAIEQTSESVVMTDPDGRITYVNPAFERVTGYTRDEVLGSNPRILKSDAHDAAFYEAMWACLVSGVTWHGEIVNRTKDGRRILENASISPVRDDAGRTTGYVAVKRDVTAEHELQDRLARSQRLEAVGQLAGGVAHDFNNLLAVMSGYGQLVADDLELGSTARADIDEVLRAAERATVLVRQLLAYSRRLVLTPEVVDPSTVIAGVLPMLSRLLGEHITIVTTHDPEAGNVLVDPGQLEQVIVNLCVNARDAMPNGGRLTIATARVGPGETPPKGEAGRAGERTRISVSDTGAGIDPETLQHIFEPFFTTKDAGRGSGMGLATVSGIVDQSGGTITVASTPGQGTTFTVDLPVAAPDAGRAPDAPWFPAVLPADRLHVLLVEDDPVVRALGRRMLESLGHRVTDAPQAQAALGVLAASDPVGLLITDVRMPGMQGPELALRARVLHPHLPVLFATAVSDDVTLPRIGDEAFRLIEKPFSTAGLARAIADALKTPGG